MTTTDKMTALDELRRHKDLGTSPRAMFLERYPMHALHELTQEGLAEFVIGVGGRLSMRITKVGQTWLRTLRHPSGESSPWLRV